MTDVQIIAAGLSDKERMALGRLTGEWSGVRLFIGVSASRLFKEPALAEVGPNYHRRLTPLGLAVRQALKEERASQLGEQP